MSHLFFPSTAKSSHFSFNCHSLKNTIAASRRQLPSSIRSPSYSLMRKLEKMDENKNPVTKEVAARAAVVFGSLPAGIATFLMHGVSSIALGLLKITVIGPLELVLGRFPLINQSKIKKAFAPFSLLQLAKHVHKAVGFGALSIVSPFIGIFSPRAVVKCHYWCRLLQKEAPPPKAPLVLPQQIQLPASPQTPTAAHPKQEFSLKSNHHVLPESAVLADQLTTNASSLRFDALPVNDPFGRTLADATNQHSKGPVARSTDNKKPTNNGGLIDSPIVAKMLEIAKLKPTPLSLVDDQSDEFATPAVSPTETHENIAAKIVVERVLAQVVSTEKTEWADLRDIGSDAKAAIRAMRMKYADDEDADDLPASPVKPPINMGDVGHAFPGINSPASKMPAASPVAPEPTPSPFKQGVAGLASKFGGSSPRFSPRKAL